MRRFLVIILLLATFGFACQTVSRLPAILLPGKPTQPNSIQISPAIPSSPASTQKSASPPTTLPGSPTANPGVTPDDFRVEIHPDNGLYVGDTVSFEVIPAQPVQDAQEQGQFKEAQAWLGGLDGTRLGQAEFQPFGIQGRLQATLLWVWNTQDLQPGNYSITFVVQPGDVTWTQAVSLQPRSALPLSEAEAHWKTARSSCCVLNYISGTAAERDLPELLSIADEQAQSAADLMQVDFSSPITITLLPRVLGQGGFTTDEVAVSYLDRNYAGSQTAIVLHHEMIHALDSRLGGEFRPSLLVEGLAVYLTGGHFKIEALMPRAAALLDSWGNPPEPGLGWYIPLAALADDFYNSQHEIGYLEAGALVEYMVNTWGWQAYSDFYRDIQPPTNRSSSQVIDLALQKHFNLTFAKLEGDFQAALRGQTASQAILDDVRLTVNYYNAVRRYQQMLDSSAYYATAWLLSTKDMQQRGIIADYLRHPDAPENLALETMLISVNQSLNSSAYPQGSRTLQAVNAVLDLLVEGSLSPFRSDSLAADYYGVVLALEQAGKAGSLLTTGSQPQRIQIEGDIAQAWVSQPGQALQEVELVRQGSSWQLQLRQNGRARPVPFRFHSLVPATGY